MSVMVQCWRCGLNYAIGLPCCPTGVLGCGAKRLRTMERVATVEALLKSLEKELHHLQNTAMIELLHGAATQAGFAVGECRQVKETIELVRTAIKNSMRSAA